MLAKLAFGKSSEKKAKQAPGEDDPTAAQDGQDGQEKPGRGQRRGSRGHGRRDYSHLPTREEIHDVPEGERVCPRCGAGYAPFGQECCEQIDWQVALTRIVHRRPTYRRTCRCPVGGVLVAPPVPKAIGKGRFTSGFVARLLCEKFVLGRPAHRIVAALGLGRAPRRRGHPGRGVRGVLAAAGPAGRVDHRAERRRRAPPASMRPAGRCSPRSRVRTVTAGGAGCSSARTPRCSGSPRHGRWPCSPSSWVSTPTTTPTPSPCPRAASCCCPRTSTPSTSPWGAWTGSTTSGVGPTSGATSSAPGTPTPNSRPGPPAGSSASPRSTPRTPRWAPWRPPPPRTRWPPRSSPPP